MTAEPVRLANAAHDATPHAAETGRVFGRRKGHRLGTHHVCLMETLLPRLRIDLSVAAPPADQASLLFGPGVREVWLEIGFGAGEHLLWQAKANPHAGIIGCEPYVNGVAKLLSGVAECDLHNVRIHDDDARAVLDWLAPGTLSRVFILFPDPWPKKRQRKRRFINPDNVAALARAMAPGAELRFATDIADYAKQARNAFAQLPDLVPMPPGDRDWPQTRYEQKAAAAGRSCTCLHFKRILNGL
jgi:tRNA (guanine-N7-)-methyltransferase